MLNYNDTHTRLVPPRIDPFSVPENEPQQLLKQGTRTRLLCGVSQGDKPLEFTWSKDGQQLSSLALPSVTVRDLDADSSVLTFTNLSAAHLGKYQCAARNAAGIARSTAQLYVQVPPFWVMEPRDVGALLGQTLTVHCQADGYPKPNVTWSRGDTSIALTNRTAPPGLRLMENGTLIMRAARKSLQGRYTCRAVNRLGQELTATISVTVHAGPRFRDSASRLAVKRDVQVTLRCIVEGDGPLHLAWRRSSSATSLLSSNYRVRIQEKESANGMSSTLTIPNAQIEDTGIYICVASNSHGQVERDFQLNILEPPEQPRQLQVRETFSRRVSLSWLPPTGAAGNFNSLIAYILQYKETNHGNWQERENLPAYSTSYILEGLQPSTSYQIRILAETSADRGPPSETIVVKTNGEAPGSSPTDLRVTTISSTRLRLSWNGLDKSNWHSSLIGYQLGFRPEEATSYNFTTIPLTDPWSNNNKMMEFTLYQLRKAVKYLLVVRAFNRHGEGPLSASVSAVTMEDVPSASPQSVRCSTSSSSSVDVTWKAPPLTEQNGQIQQYQLHFERISHTDSLTAVGPQMKTVDGFHATLTGLAPYSTYRFRVEAVNRKGAGPLSPPVTCLTDESVPGAPADIKAYSSGPSATTLCWTPPLHPNGEILHYTLSIKAGGSTFGNGASVQRHTVPATQTHYELMSNVNVAIPPPSFYEIWLTATNRAGVGDKSKVLRHSPGFKPNSASASICSFGRRLIQPWRTAVEFPCLVIGTAGQAQTVNWTHNGNSVRDETVFEARKIAMHLNHSTNHHQHSSLSLTDLKRTDSGNYSCSVGSGESITHHLLVLVPPSPPILHVLQTGMEHIQVEWKANKGIEDTQTSSLLGFLLHWRHSDGGDWEERELDRFSSSAQLDNLRCGTRYHIYVSSYNAVGTSPPSNTVTARTKGDGPLVPASVSSVVTANSSRVAIHLNSWQERGCPILSFAVEYKMDGETYWNTISEDVQNLPMVFIDDIQPSTAYQLRVRARTSAGSVPVQYDFVTLDTSGQTPMPDRIHRAGRQLVLLPSNENLDSNRSGSHVILPWWLIGAVSAVGTCSLLGLMVACVCLYKTRNESRRLMVASTLPSNSTLIDGNATWNRSHKSGSTTVLDRNTASSKRSSTFELHSMGDKMSINYSPDDHDDIYPYATFELHRERPRSPKKIHDNPPDFIRLKGGRENNKMNIPSRPPPSWSELSTIEIERHFQSSPTISDSELENLAVPPEFNGHKYQMPVGTTSSAHSIRGVIHQGKDYPSKSSLKRLSIKAVRLPSYLFLMSASTIRFSKR